MTGLVTAARRVSNLWLSVWPLWAVLVFAMLAATRLLPAGLARAVVATPILLTVPGSLTLGALFGRHHRPVRLTFFCYTVLISVVWTVFGSLALYLSGILITAVHLYWCLLIISVALGLAAGTRLVLDWQGRGRRVATRPDEVDPDRSAAEARAAEVPPARTGVLAVAAAAVVGVGLLAGGGYAFEHHHGPPAPGYTTLSWTRPRVVDQAPLPLSDHGRQLAFQIVHHQPGTTRFTLTATWLGHPSRSLAQPVSFSIGPDRTYHGSLSVPSLPTGCVYRLVLTLTADHQVDPLTKSTPTWTINAEVQERGQPTRGCAAR